MIQREPPVERSTQLIYTEDESFNKNYIIKTEIDCLKKLRILLAVKLLTAAELPATTDMIEHLTFIPRKNISQLMIRYACIEKLLTREIRSGNERTARGFYKYSLTKKGQSVLDGFLDRFNANLTLKQRRPLPCNMEDVVLLPGLSDELLSTLTAENNRNRTDKID